MRALALFALASALLAVPAGGQPPTPPVPRPLTPVQQEKIKEAQGYSKEATALEKAGKLKEAIAAAEKMLALEREVYGNVHEEVAGSLNRIGRMRVRLEDWAGARTAHQERLEIRTTLYGKGDWQVTDARLALADVDLFEKMTPDDRASAHKATAANAEGVRLYGLQKHEDAVRQFKDALAGKRKALGDAHPSTLTTMNNLAQLYHGQGRYADAEPLHKDALAGYRKALGDAHPLTLTSMNNLAQLYHDQARYADAEPLHKESLAGHRKALGDAHPSTLTTMNNLALLYHDQARYADAEPLYADALAGKRKALGDAHPDTLTTMNNLAGLYHNQGRYADAERLYKDALAGKRKALGDAHPDTLRSMNNLAQLYRDQGRYADAEPLLKDALAGRRKALGDAHPDTLQSMNNLAHLYNAQARNADAERLYKEALAGYRKALGDAHPATLMSINNLAALYRAQARYADAEPLFKEALAGYRKALGDAHPDTLRSMNNLAHLYNAQARNADAERLYKEALAGYRKALGDAHPSTLLGMSNMASLYKAQGRYADAEPLLKDALAGYRKALGDAHPDTLGSMNDLAHLFDAQGRYADAETLYKDALAGKRKALGDAHPSTLTIMNNLAQLYHGQARYADAEPLFKEALAGYRKALGDAHPSTLTTMNNLAELYHEQARYADAEPLFKGSLAGSRKALGDAHPDTLRSMNNLAELYRDQGRYADAELLYKDALAGYRKALGDAHPDTLTTMNNLAGLYLAQARYADAEPLFKDALAGTRAHLDRTAAGQAEGHQLTFRSTVRYRLDSFLSFGVTARTPAADRYAEALAWKGAAFARRAQLRAAVEKAADPALTKLLAEASDVARRLATLASSTPPADQLTVYRKTLQELSERKDEIDQELARRSEPFRTARATAALTPDQLAKVLPADVTLVDYLEYWHFRPDPDTKGKWLVERRLLAYVVRNGKPVVEVELGPAQPIADAVDQWRNTISRTSPSRDDKDPAAVLRQKVWESVAGHLGGARVVLVSPDGALGRLPFGALPGADPKKYLVEEVALVVTPVPQLVPELFAGAREPVKNPALLLVGDVDYDAEPGTPGAGTGIRHWTAERSGSAGKWTHLPGTRDEAAAIRGAFAARFAAGTATLLDRTGATEAAVRERAPGSRYLHVATHGFFAPPKPLPPPGRAPIDDAFGDRRRAADVHPGLQSGLVLAGANRPPKPGVDDGVLTALEVADLDLSGVELAVLSACETRLGKDVGGEGVLGLERAFQAAGARSTVASLWKVPDRATQVLMVRFYQNLWDKKMSKLDALREAQLWMLKEGAADPALTRGAKADDPDGTPVPKGGRMPPYYWAAFTLAGDWR